MEDQPQTASDDTSRRHREERMRYEVLAMLFRAAAADPREEVRCWSFAQDLGVWHAEVFRAIDFLDQAGLVEYCGAGPLVRITDAGIRYVRGGAGHAFRVPDHV